MKKINPKYSLPIRFFFIVVQFLIGFNLAFSQVNPNMFFSDIVMRVDTNAYNWKNNTRIIAQKESLIFEYFQENQTVELNLKPKLPDVKNVTYSIMPSNDFEILEELVITANQSIRCKLRFKNLSTSDLLNILIKKTIDSVDYFIDIPLFQTHRTIAHLNPPSEDIFLGEEKRIELSVNTSDNIVTDVNWQVTKEYEYRIINDQGKIYANIIPLVQGNIKFILRLKTHRPYIDQITKKFNYEINTNSVEINIKKSRLPFLRPDLRDIILTSLSKEGIEIQIENHRNLLLNKTYRIENQEVAGGALFAEFHTIQRLGNDRVLCVFRPYRHHNSTDGYLYIKDGDQPIFLTNFNILKETNVKKVNLMRDGINWTENLNVFPGETVDLKIEGDGINLGNFTFDDIDQIYFDSIMITENAAFFRISVPINIRKKHIQIFNAGKETKFRLNVNEYERPKTFDYISIHVGQQVYDFNEIVEPIYFEKSLSNILIHFNPDKIDEPGYLYGVQNLEVEIRLLDDKNQLIELQTLDNIRVCPGEQSVRHQFYKLGRCSDQWINVNDIFSKKTHTLGPWFKVEIKIRHKSTAYNIQGQTKKIMIVAEKRTTFDIDLSLPAGLLIKTLGDQSAPTFTGVSLAMLANLSFYKTNELQKQLPYGAGIGFLAQNALNYNPNAQRDFAVVAIGSLKSVKQNRKINLTLYSGLGVFINTGKWFYLFGPGVMVMF